MTQLSQPNILIIGQGDIGAPVTNKLTEQGYQVTGLARGERSSYKLHESAKFIQADALTLTSEQVHDFSHIAIIVTPDEYNVDAYKNTYLGIAQHIAQLSDNLPKLERVVFISSTGVYGQDDGEWIDETIAPATPKRESSVYILKAEQALQQAYADKTVIIRPSGIYGVERLMRIRKAQEQDKTAMPEYAWSNRIMDSDLITLIAKVLTLESAPKPVYLATDYRPVTSYEMLKWLCEQLGTTPPTIDESKPVSGKRLHSNIPRDWLEFPDWQAGYQYILAKL
ncbi:SDR family oxidoreductase [Psychrobacter pygoscelis]|uniref:SDR family oxidoreductase n=1 Tax=Psychrobacter pygoscelis TaxID=2488563 RepID=UPI00103E444A|nr:SDR family oxidoreductase [Psychrobacter pygoscelis]